MRTIIQLMELAVISAREGKDVLVCVPKHRDYSTIAGNFKVLFPNEKIERKGYEIKFDGGGSIKFHTPRMMMEGFQFDHVFVDSDTHYSEECWAKVMAMLKETGEVTK